jgi:ribonucleoside-diphosphate reductase alpha chain
MIKGIDYPNWMDESQGLKTLQNGYLLEGETVKQAWERVSNAAAKQLGKPELAPKFFDIIWKGWLGLASPVCSNLGSERGLPISCYSVHIPDSIDGIYKTLHEQASLSKQGGGVGIYAGDIRARGIPIKNGANGHSEGVVPWMKIFDVSTIATSQGSVRRGASAVYLPIDHGDIKEFLRIRRPEGDVNRQCLNLHQGVCITDEFMHKALGGDKPAQELLLEVYKTRLETGEPYIFFTDNINKANPECYKDKGLHVSTSNICSEIVLHTDNDHSFVCCLSSMNLTKWDEWKDTDAVYLATWFLDAVMSEFIEKAKTIPGFERSVRFAEKSRALGLGVLGWHSLLQSEGTAFDSFRAKLLNRAVFSRLKSETERATKDLAVEYGEPEWCVGHGRRNTHLMALAPTVSNATICGNVSPSIEPWVANAFAKKTAKGVFIQHNQQLKLKLAELGQDSDEVWKSIVNHEGSVQHLDFLDSNTKDVFKTAFEIDQRAIVEQACERQQFIDQAQSLNLFFSSSVDPKYFHSVHVQAWKGELKTLYYVRSSSVLKADLSSREDSKCEACEA